jgi:hypothetical protein
LSYKDQVVKIPVAPTGPLLPKVVNLCDSDDSDSLDASDGDEVGEDFGPNKMLPPIGFSSVDYDKKKTRGRPREKRIRSQGAQGDDGARLRKRSNDIRQGRGSAESGRSVLNGFKL